MSAPIRVTIIGSYKRHWDDIKRARRAFIRGGMEVLRPVSETVIENESGDWVRVEGDPAEAHLMREKQLAAIRASDIVYVVNPGTYIGYAGQFECGYAHGLHIPIYYLEQPFETSSAPGQVGKPLNIMQSLAAEQIKPADSVLLDDFVRGHALHVGRRGATLILQGADDHPVLAHDIAGPLAIRETNGITLRPLTSTDGAPYRMQLLAIAHQGGIPTRESAS